DPQDHFVTRLQKAPQRLLADLEQAAATHRPAPEHLARPPPDVGGGAREDAPEREVDAGPAAPARLGSVDRCRHLELEAVAGSAGGEVIWGHQPRPPGRCARL